MKADQVDPKRCAIVLVDLANDFVNPGGVLADAGGSEYQEKVRDIIPRLQRLVAAARDAGATVIYATDCHDQGDAELNKWPPHSMRGSHGAKIIPELEPQAGDVLLEKQTYSSFHGTGLENILRDKGIETLYITGLHTDCCCRHTSGDAFQRGFDLVWVTDALRAFTDEAHESGLDYCKAYYATDPERQFKNTEEVVASWLES